MSPRVSIAAFAFMFTLTTLLSAAERNALTDEEKSAGWKLLFDGTSKTGWRGYNQPEAPEKWVVEDGSLKGKGGGDLMTAGQYDYYELSLEWNLPKGGNSGIIYRCAETKGPSYVTGPEIQVLDNMDTNSKNSAGSCYDLYSPLKDVLKPNGQWNQVKLIIKPGNEVEHWMNGEKVCEYQIGSDDWNDRIAKSKWAKEKEFGKVTKGHIALQDHGNEVWYRNIKIREIKPEQPTMDEPFPVKAAKNSWALALLALVLYILASTGGPQLQGRAGMLISGIGSLCATFVFLGAFALSIIGLIGVRKYGSEQILLPAMAGLLLTGTPIAFVVVMIVSAWMER